jgi:hypothetical protein
LIPVGQTQGLEYRVFGGDLWITAALEARAGSGSDDASASRI